MSTDAAVAWDLEFTVDGVPFGVMLAEAYDQQGDLRHKAQGTSLTALLEALPLGEKLNSAQNATFMRGIGLDYNWAPGVYTRTDGYALPAGAVTQSGVESRAVGEGVAFAEYGGDLWIATNLVTGTGKVNRNSGGAATGASAFATSKTLAAGRYVRDLIVADDGSGTSVLFASSSDSAGLNGMLHKWDGSSWTDTDAPGTGSGNDFGTANGRNRMAKAFWRTRDGIGAWRLVSITRPNYVSYTVPFGDPMTAAGWIEAAIHVDTAYTLQELAAFRTHVFVGAQDNLYDIQEDGSAPGLTDYIPRMIQAGTGAAVLGHDGYVYLSVGQGLERIDVGTNGQLQENPGTCTPGWGTRMQAEMRGYVTAMCVDQGWLVAAIYNPTTHRSYVCYGKDRRILGLDSPNPLIWHGPELLVDADYKITRMWTSGLAGDLRLWCSATSQGGGGLLVFWMSLPLAGSPIDDLVSGGLHRFATGTAVGTYLQPSCRIELLPPEWEGSTTITDQHTLVTRGLSVTRAVDGTTSDDGVGTKLTLEIATDPPPDAITWDTVGDVTTSPSQTLEGGTTKGELIWRRISFLSPNGASTPPKPGVLDVCRMDSWRAVPAVSKLPLTMVYGDGIRNLENVESDRDPDWITEQLVKLTTGARTTLKTREGHRYTVKAIQALDTTVEYNDTGTYGKTVTATLDVLVMSQVA